MQGVSYHEIFLPNITGFQLSIDCLRSNGIAVLSTSATPTFNPSSSGVAVKTLSFTKMQALGNDFMVVDAVDQPFNLTPSQIQQLADRHYGVGFDQLLVLAPSPSDQADFSFLIFNSDGSTAEQCGNGARCMARFIHKREMSPRRAWRLITVGKVTSVTLETDNTVTAELDEPSFEPSKVPFVTTTSKPPYSLLINNQEIKFGIVGVGNPHAVIHVDEASLAAVDEVGAVLSKHINFPAGVNVGFMQVLSPDHIFLRVYERGAGQTLACGSGACAAVAVGRQMGLLAPLVQVSQKGGELWINWPGPGSPLRMRGPAHFVYEGLICS